MRPAIGRAERVKRFYKNASITTTANGYEIHLDGKPVRTPTRNILLTQIQPLAEAMAEEWQRQGEKICPETMPLTQLVMTSIDKISPQRAAHQAEILEYLDTDLLCYRAEETESFGRRQKEFWDPVLAWFTKKYGIILSTTTQLTALQQPPLAHERVEAEVEDLDDLRFTILHVVTAETGSLILGLAFLNEALDQEQVFRAALVEDLLRAEIYLEEIYGASPDQEKRRGKLRAELHGASLLLSLLNHPPTD